MSSRQSLAIMSGKRKDGGQLPVWDLGSLHCFRAGLVLHMQGIALLPEGGMLFSPETSEEQVEQWDSAIIMVGA